MISPVLGGIIAASFLYFIKHRITYQTDMAQAGAGCRYWLRPWPGPSAPI